MTNDIPKKNLSVCGAALTDGPAIMFHPGKPPLNIDFRVAFKQACETKFGTSFVPTMVWNELSKSDDIVRAYGEWYAEGLRDYLREEFNVDLPSLAFEQYIPSSDGTRGLNSLVLEMDARDAAILYGDINESQLKDGIQLEKAQDTFGFLKGYSSDPEDWMEHGERGLDVIQRGLLLGIAHDFSFSTAGSDYLDPNALSDKIARKDWPEGICKIMGIVRQREQKHATSCLSPA